MKKDFSIFYIFCFIVALAAVGLFYFNYYGINVEISNEEVKEKINNKLPKEIDTSIGNFIVKEIQEINLYPENQFEAKFDTHLKFSNRNKIKITVYLKGDIKFYKINNFLGAKNIEITQTLFHEQAIPLSNKMIKAINRQIRKHLPTNLFYKNDIHFVSEFTKDYIESFETDFDKIKIHFRLFRSKKGYY